MAQLLFCPHCISSVQSQDECCPECRFDRPATGWPADEHVGRLIANKYEITERLGEGGFGVVYRARQLKGDHDLGDVVLKLLRPHYSINKSIRRRFVDEARAARALDTPHVVKVFDFDFDERGLPFLVMEFLRGDPLDKLLEEGPLDPKRVVSIALQLTEAMQDCHQAGILHRDLKPSNILLQGRNDFVKVLDFGIARMPDSAASQTVMGTPMYMAPEQILRQAIDKRVDIYALGVVLFECFTGSLPMEQDTSDGSIAAKESPRMLRQITPDLPKSLERLLAKMMAPRPSQRPSSMADVHARLRAIAHEQGWLAASEGARSSAKATVRAGPGRAVQGRRSQPRSVGRRSRRRWIVGVGVGVVVLVGAIVVRAVLQPTDSPPNPPVAHRQHDASAGHLDAPSATTTQPAPQKNPLDAAVKREAPRPRHPKVRRGKPKRRGKTTITRPRRPSHRKHKNDYSLPDGGL